MDSHLHELTALSKHRWRVALTLTVLMMLIYFGFMLLVPLAKGWMASEVMPGLSWGILLGALVILAAWALIVIYTLWANSYDRKVRAHRESGR